MTGLPERVAPLTILADTREQAIPPFPAGVVVERITLGEADYTTEALIEYARIERKSREDFSACVTRERDRFVRELERLRAFPFRLIIVEADLGDWFDGKSRSAVHPNAITGSVCSWLARYGVPTIFAHDPHTCGRMIAGILRRLEEERAREVAA